MTAEAIIKELRELPANELNKVGTFLRIDDLAKELQADHVAAHRDDELENEEVSGISHEEIFERVRSEFR